MRLLIERSYDTVVLVVVIIVVAVERLAVVAAVALIDANVVVGFAVSTSRLLLQLLKLR